MSSLLEKIGKTAVDHCAFMVQSRMMPDVIALFKDLGWWEDSPLLGEKYEVRFVRPEGASTRVQLTEHKGETFEEPLVGAHVGLVAGNPREAAEALVLYAQEHGWEDAEMVPNKADPSKWWVSIPSIMAFKIEFVPAE